jgi:RNA polymerase sigma-70 factor (ECF subfamily)
VEDRPPAEADLIARAQRGDERAFGELVALHGGTAFRTAHLVLGDAAEAEDATQEGFVRAYRALSRFREGAPFRPWLLRIVLNAARNRRRSAGRRQHLELRVEVMTPRDEVAPSAEAVAIRHERRAALLDAVNALASDDRFVIGARYFLDLSEEEIAIAAGIPRGTVKSRLARSRGRLAAALQRSGSEWIDG